VVEELYLDLKGRVLEVASLLSLLYWFQTLLIRLTLPLYLANLNQDQDSLQAQRHLFHRHLPRQRILQPEEALLAQQQEVLLDL
jgi:hypothetical protein